MDIHQGIEISYKGGVVCKVKCFMDLNSPQELGWEDFEKAMK